MLVKRLLLISISRWWSAGLLNVLDWLHSGIDWRRMMSELLARWQGTCWPSSGIICVTWRAAWGVLRIHRETRGGRG
jgi:hypothetical protein